MNEVSGNNKNLLFEPPLPVTWAGRSSLERNPRKVRHMHIIEVSELKYNLK